MSLLTPRPTSAGPCVARLRAERNRQPPRRLNRGPRRFAAAGPRPRPTSPPPSPLSPVASSRLPGRSGLPEEGRALPAPPRPTPAPSQQPQPAPHRARGQVATRQASATPTMPRGHRRPHEGDRRAPPHPTPAIDQTSLACLLDRDGGPRHRLAAPTPRSTSPPPRPPASGPSSRIRADSALSRGRRHDDVILSCDAALALGPPSASRPAASPACSLLRKDFAVDLH